MPTIHRCPENILRMFDEGNSSEGMREAIAWVSGIALVKGDIVLMPHPNTGELISYRFDPKNARN